VAGDDWEVGYEHAAGAYANAFHVWHTEHEFTVDFGARQLSELAPVHTVARIRVPTTLLFDLLKMLNDDLAVYEKEWGEIAPRRAQEESGS
jgi:hypothetical protein